MEPTNSDDRRDLYEFEYPVSKLVVAKKDCVLGEHYHKLKDEMFILINGTGTAWITVEGETKHFEMTLLERVYVPRGTSHCFHLSAGSILLGYCSKPYDPGDDHRI